MTPRVSVLLPVFRPDLDLLRQAIGSVVDQTLREWELVIVEDTSEVSLPQFNDPRIRIVRRAVRTSLASALNEGLSVCAAPLVARLDGDDICEPSRLALQVAALELHPEVAVVGSALTVIDETGRTVGHRRYPMEPADVARSMRRYNSVAHPSVTYRRDIILRAGGYRDVRVEDYDLWCRLIVSGAAVMNVPEALLRYRFHRGALKRQNVREVIAETIAIKQRYFHAQFTMGDRARVAAERLLLRLPPALVVRLFSMIEYRSA